MTPVPRQRFGTLLALLFAGASFLLTVVLVAVVGRVAGNQVRADIGNGLAELARQTADKLDQDMFERYREVRLIAQRLDLSNHDDARRYLAEVQTTYPLYAWIGAAGMDGKVQVATRGMLEGADVSQRPWFRGALKGIYQIDVHDAKLLARLLTRPGEEPPRFVDVAFPYRAADGTPAGVLGAHLSWGWAGEVARAMVSERARKAGVDALVVSREGVVLLGPQELVGQRLQTASAQAKGSGAQVETWADGKRYLVGYSASQGHRDYPGLGWIILVRQDLDSAFLPVVALQRQVLAAGATIALLFTLLGLWTARRISRPLAQLSEAAAQVEAGTALALPAYGGSIIEVQTLSRSLSSLVSKLLDNDAALRELNQTLESRVAERTSELATALAQVLASEARIHAILETAQDSFVRVDRGGRVSAWNGAAERLFGWQRDEAMGRAVADLIVPPRLHERFYASLSSFDGQNQPQFTRQRLELRFLDRQGREFAGETTISLTGAGADACYNAFIHDITQRKEVERMKDEFVSTVSHELRTPITSIRFSLGMLVDDTLDQPGRPALPPDVRRLLNVAHASCERLVRLINDILDVQKMAAGQMEYQFSVQPLPALALSALDSMIAFADQHEVTLALDHDGSPCAVNADSDRLTQVLVNLLSNAIKFSPTGGTVTLRVATEDRFACLDVRDHGPGIPADFQGRIFERFAQADGSNTRTRSGTGLGLAICRDLVAAHHGEISFTTAAGAGTTFHVRLPLTESPATAAPAGV